MQFKVGDKVVNSLGVKHKIVSFPTRSMVVLKPEKTELAEHFEVKIPLSEIKNYVDE